MLDFCFLEPVRPYNKSGWQKVTSGVKFFQTLHLFHAKLCSNELKTKVFANRLSRSATALGCRGKSAGIGRPLPREI